jgi:hypothetical protein
MRIGINTHNSIMVQKKKSEGNGTDADQGASTLTTEFNTQKHCHLQI